MVLESIYLALDTPENLLTWKSIASTVDGVLFLEFLKSNEVDLPDKLQDITLHHIVGLRNRIIGNLEDLRILRETDTIKGYIQLSEQAMTPCEDLPQFKTISLYSDSKIFSLAEFDQVTANICEQRIHINRMRIKIASDSKLTTDRQMPLLELDTCVQLLADFDIRASDLTVVESDLSKILLRGLPHTVLLPRILLQIEMDSCDYSSDLKVTPATIERLSLISKMLIYYSLESCAACVEKMVDQLGKLKEFKVRIPLHRNNDQVIQIIPCAHGG